MINFLSGISLFLMSFLAYAIEDAAAPPPAPAPVSATSMIIFAVVFFGMIGGFFWYMWKNEQKRKDRESGRE